MSYPLRSLTQISLTMAAWLAPVGMKRSTVSPARYDSDGRANEYRRGVPRVEQVASEAQQPDERRVGAAMVEQHRAREAAAVRQHVERPASGSSSGSAGPGQRSSPDVR